MAVLTGLYGEAKVEYEGCVLDTWEHNGYHDSDWYALVWDRDAQELKQIEYDTTRALQIPIYLSARKLIPAFLA